VAVSTTAEPIPPLLSPVRRPVYDRWRERVAAEPRLQRLYGWLAPLLVTLLAGILRFWNLGHPHVLVFDETYYVKDAWSQWNLGYAASWPDGADARFAAGEPNIFTADPSFVVHPPLGKYLIGFGMWLFGPDSSFGWRAMAALFGTALVLLLFLVAKTLTNSTVFATVASFLLAIDGLGIVMSRVGLLDVFLAFFILLAFWFALLDRRRHLDRLAAAIVARRVDDAPSPGEPCSGTDRGSLRPAPPRVRRRR
jgi:dolichyl-phosphate-mannose--protein O-mannosyl transferase